MPLFVSPRTCRLIPRNKRDRKSTRLNSSHLVISYAVFCLKKKKPYIKRQKAPLDFDFVDPSEHLCVEVNNRQWTGPRSRIARVSLLATNPVAPLVIIMFRL